MGAMMKAAGGAMGGMAMPSGDGGDGGSDDEPLP
jgi:hypothetical protein